MGLPEEPPIEGRFTVMHDGQLEPYERRTQALLRAVGSALQWYLRYGRWIYIGILLLSAIGMVVEGATRTPGQP
jgi:hypothetical protein